MKFPGFFALFPDKFLSNIFLQNVQIFLLFEEKVAFYHIIYESCCFSRENFMNFL